MKDEGEEGRRMKAERIKLGPEPDTVTQRGTRQTPCFMKKS
jgi:hypothetical protein